MATSSGTSMRGLSTDIARQLLASPTPWIISPEWHRSMRGEDVESWKRLAGDVPWPGTHGGYANAIVMMLPYLVEAAAPKYPTARAVHLYCLSDAKAVIRRPGRRMLRPQTV